MHRSPSVLRVTGDGTRPDRPVAALDRAAGGIDVERIETVADAVAALEDSTVDCVLGDVDLPDGDGVDLLEVVRADHPDLPVVLYADDEDAPIDAAIEAGLTDYLTPAADSVDYRLLASRVQRRSRPPAAPTAEAGDTDHLTDALPDGVVVIDESETIRAVNAPLAAWLGVERSAVVGRSLAELVDLGILEPEGPSRYREAVDVLQSSEREAERFEITVHREEDTRTVDVRLRLRPGSGDRSAVATMRDVTNRAARESELERYETLLGAMPDTVVMTDTDGNHLEVHGFEGWSGYEREELLDEHISMTTTEEYVERAEEVAAELFLDDDREKATYEMEIETKDGELLPFENHMTLLPPDDDGRIPGTMSVLRDISERKERERELELYETTVESTHDGIAVIDEHGEHLMVNSVYADAVGLPPEEIVGTSYEERDEGMDPSSVPEDFEDRWVHAWAEAHEQGRSEFRFEITVGIEGDETVLDNRVTAMKREDGSVIYIVVGRDVTERKRRQRQIEQLHRTTRDLMAAETHGDVARVVVDAVADTLGFPANVVRLVDETGERLEPVTVTDRAQELLGDRSSRPVEGSALGEGFQSGEVLLVDDLGETDADDAETDVRSLLSVPIGDHGVLSIVDDEVGAYDDSDVHIAEIVAANAEAAFDRVEREATLRERERALSRQIDRLDQFARIVSHDLRNPLNVAKGHLTFLEEQVEDGEHVETVTGALDRMDAIIEDVLTLARKGDEATDLAPVDLAETAGDCWDNVDTAGATLDVTGDVVLQADESRLQQLLENLFRNAVEHVGEDVTIRVGALDGGFFVEDDGPGIPAEERGSVLDMGYSTSEEGTGFGLNIVQTIAEAHEWLVEVTDGADGGARFEFTGVEVAD